MTVARFKTRLQRLEHAGSTHPSEKAWEAPATVEEARRRLGELVERIRARQARLEADLASGDRKRVAAARGRMAEIEAYHATPAARALRAKIEASWAALRARGALVPEVQGQ